RAHRQMHLAHGEGVELEGRLGRRIGIWLLLARQLDIEADRRRADVGRAAVGRLHDPGTAARRNNVVALTVDGSKRAPALGRTTMVVRTPHERSRWSALAISRRKRTPCIESPRMKFGSDAGRR